jgi:hypothetical protein
MSSATIVKEAIWLEENGADVIIAQGAEAGGHRGMFLTDNIRQQPGTFALVPQVVDAVKVPVIAAGGIADGRGIAAAFALGASGVQIGSAYLRCPESKVIAPARTALAQAHDDSTVITNVMTGRPARGVANRVMREVGPISPDAPAFPHAATALGPLKAAGRKARQGRFHHLWAGQAVGWAAEMRRRKLTRSLAGAGGAVGVAGWIGRVSESPCRSAGCAYEIRHCSCSPHMHGSRPELRQKRYYACSDRLDVRGDNRWEVGNRLPWTTVAPAATRGGPPDVDSSGRRNVSLSFRPHGQRRESKGGVLRALILTLSILAIIDSAHFAKAGLSSTPRETSAGAIRQSLPAKQPSRPRSRSASPRPSVRKRRNVGLTSALGVLRRRSMGPFLMHRDACGGAFSLSLWQGRRNGYSSDRLPQRPASPRR